MDGLIERVADVALAVGIGIGFVWFLLEALT